MMQSDTTYRKRLPFGDGRIFLTDGGLETSMVFHEGRDLPCFAAFDLLKDEAGREALRKYFRRYLRIAEACGAGFVLESPTWRSSPDWGRRIGYDSDALAQANRDAIRLMAELRREWAPPQAAVISGCLGPRGDGYDPGSLMSRDEAESYHAWQIGVFAGTEADLVTAVTMTNSAEAAGIARAAKAADMPVVISFTVETDGRLPTGESLADAIHAVDEASDAAPVHYMINCAHPTHFAGVLESGAPWIDRLAGLRANASRCSHAELDDATELDDGDPEELGAEYAALLSRLRRVSVLGGCCGTDHRHIAAIAESCVSQAV